MSWTAPGDDGVQGRAALYEIRFSENDLSNPAEWARALPLAAPPPADVFATENDTFNAFYGHTSGFVGQHYTDFLSRDPDSSGQLFWTNNKQHRRGRKELRQPEHRARLP